MTIKQYIKQHGWQVEADTSCPYRSMDVDINFDNAGMSDETQFCINAYDTDELSELFAEFCKECNIPNNMVTNITVARVYEQKASSVSDVYDMENGIDL